MSAPPQVSRPRPELRRPRRRVTRRGWIVVTILGLATVAVGFVLLTRQPLITLEGVENDQIITGSELPLSLLLTVDRDVETISARLDDEEIPIERTERGATIELAELEDGPHLVSVSVDRGSLVPAVSTERNFLVDTTPPQITIVSPMGPVPALGPVEVKVRTDDAASVVTIAGSEVVASDDGSFAISFPNPPEAPVQVEARDAVGNSIITDVAFQLDLPGNPGSDPIRGVHASGYTWSTPALKDPIMAMIASGQINTVEIDLKDEAGHIWWRTSVPLAAEIGAIEELWNLGEVVRELHALGVRVIGRLVVFRDPVLAAWAVEQGETDWIVQNPDGTPYGQYGGYTNPFSTDVWEYNIAIGEEAARLGVDDILYDYVRRPDAYMDQLRFPLQGNQTAEDAIVGFLEASEPRIHAAGARLGASVFGIAATHPDQIAQPIPRIARTVDYVAPMVYPSHWGPNEYGVVHPNASPYDIVFRSLSEFQRQVEGTDATVLGWLQDFSLGIDYGPAEVRAQIEAAAAAGVLDFLLWDAAATYTADALDRH
ncbi:MAG TPA: putative glycoside hydrolase [Acidimicrobiia bacterium]|nr:putative glycoside hydrolase [Acidimicrobiia bacterium]